MIKTKTVLILGAGASCDYGFPVGEKLKEIILDLLKHPSRCQGVLDCGFSYADDAVSFRKAFEDYLGAGTIDAFLRDRPQFADFGRHMIAAALLPCEQGMKKNPAENWYRRIYGVLNTDGFKGFEENSLSIVTFNYDRSLEFYLFESLSGHGRTDEECAQQINGIPIIHVHGQLGYLPWQGKDQSCTVGFGSSKTTNPIKKAVKEIKIMHEARGNDDSFIRAHGEIQLAKRIYILGFGYDPSNLERLSLLRLTKDRKIDLRGTAFELGRQEMKIANEHMNNSSQPANPEALRYQNVDNKRLVDKTVYMFLRDHVVFE